MNDIWKLCVKNFPFKTNEDDLMERFANYGCTHVKIIAPLRENSTMKSNIGILTFSSYDEAERAYLHEDNAIFFGRYLKIKFDQTCIASEKDYYKEQKRMERNSDRKNNYVSKIETEEPFSYYDNTNTNNSNSDIIQTNSATNKYFQNSVDDINYKYFSSANLTNKYSNNKVKPLLDKCLVNNENSCNTLQNQTINDIGRPKIPSQNLCSKINIDDTSDYEKVQFNTSRQENCINLLGKDLVLNFFNCTSIKDDDFLDNYISKDNLVILNSSKSYIQFITNELSLPAQPDLNDICLNIIVNKKINNNIFWVTILNEGQHAKLFSKVCQLVDIKKEDLQNIDVEDNIALSLFEEIYCRVYVIDIISETKAEVFYIDYGNKMIVDYSELYKVPDDYMNIPPLVYPIASKDNLKMYEPIYVDKIILPQNDNLTIVKCSSNKK